MDREDQQDLLDAVIARSGIDPKDKRFPKGEVLADVFSFALNTGRTHRGGARGEVSALPRVQRADRRGAEEIRGEEAGGELAGFRRSAGEDAACCCREHPAIAERYQRQFQFVLVDEYQDTNRLQADFIDMLADASRQRDGGRRRRADRSTRGAARISKTSSSFPKRYPSAKVYKIETNYRSVPDILEVANAAIAANVNQFARSSSPRARRRR